MLALPLPVVASARDTGRILEYATTILVDSYRRARSDGIGGHVACQLA